MVKKAKNYISDQLRTSSLCKGFDLGITCVACCSHYPRCGLNSCLETPFELYLSCTLYDPDQRPKTFFSLNDVNWFSGESRIVSGARIVGAPINPEHYAKSIKAIGSNYNESLNSFNQLLLDNTRRFDDYLNAGFSIQEVAKAGQFVGLIDDRPGCLLHSYSTPDTNKSYRPDVCVSHLCGLASYSEKTNRSKWTKFFLEDNNNNNNSYIKEIFSEFAAHHSGDPLFTSLSYSRMIHFINQHQRVLELLDIDIFFCKKTKSECLTGLEKLFEIVTR